MSRLLGVIGDPVSHSLSPLIHNGWLRDYGIEATYMAMQVPGADLESALKTLRDNGLMGLNVTLPHKQDVLKLAASQSALAGRIGAANCLVPDQAGGWRAENTDAPGFRETLQAGDIHVTGERVFVLGAGGAARAVAITLSDLRADLVICNRTLARADALIDETGIKARVLSLSDGLLRARDARLVVNTLSLGHDGKALSLPVGEGRVFYDVSYGRAARQALTEARQKGWRTLDGLAMLVAQAAYSFEHWFGVRPDMAEAHVRARRAVEAAQ
jgi:shikimate dehydrogenase